MTFTSSSCVLNNNGFDVCQEDGLFQGPALVLNSGAYWLELGNAEGSNPNDPIGWDENSGIGCTSPGCPSQGADGLGTIPSESFTLLGGVGNGTTPEPGSLVLFATGAIGVAGILRRRLL